MIYDAHFMPKFQINIRGDFWFLLFVDVFLILPAMHGMVVFKIFTSKNNKFYKIKQSDLFLITLLDRTLGLTNLKC